MNLYSYNSLATEKHLKTNFGCIENVAARFNHFNFNIDLEILFNDGDKLTIPFQSGQRIAGHQFYQFVSDEIKKHRGLNKPQEKLPEIKFDVPPPQLLNEAYPNCDPNYESKVWKTIKSDFGRIIDVLFPIPFLVLYSVVFFSFGFMLAYLLT